MRIFAYYNTISSFQLPAGVVLLTPEQCQNVNDDDGPVAWYWWVKWNTLYYYDADLKKHEVEADQEPEHKWPESTEYIADDD